MGGDGGEIPLRSDLVKIKGWKFLNDKGSLSSGPNTLVHTVDKTAAALFKRKELMHHCKLSHKELTGKICVDTKGYMYSAEILKSLQQNSHLPKAIRESINYIEDIVYISCNAPADGLYSAFDPKNMSVQCMLTGEKFDSECSKFYVSIDCGCVWSNKIIQCMKKQFNELLHCPVCNKSTKCIELLPLENFTSKEMHDALGTTIELTKNQYRTSSKYKNIKGLIVKHAKKKKYGEERSNNIRVINDKTL